MNEVGAGARSRGTILLIGARGSGKSTIGRLLARATASSFVDLDELTLERLGGESVAAVWARSGEAAWRRAETEVLAEVLEADRPAIVASGGGTPTIDAARRLIERYRRLGRLRVAYLECPAEELLRRLAIEPGDRPSITGADPMAELPSILADRRSTYQAVADLIHTEYRRSPEQIARDLAHSLALPMPGE